VFLYPLDFERDGRRAARTSYAANMASQWKTLQRLQKNLENLVFTEGPELIRQLQQLPTVQRGIKLALDVIAGDASEPPAEITAGRPVTRDSAPTAHRARKLVYSANLDGRADPGEIVWTWVTHQEDPTRGQDRPVLVVGRDQHTLLGLMMSSQQTHAADRDWVSIGSGSWDDEGRQSWVRLDRVLDVPEEGIRRQGAILERAVFEVVAARLRRDYSWS
jgi:PemK-like, MazF-like toxin of type II toxin-antitoxin system